MICPIAWPAWWEGASLAGAHFPVTLAFFLFRLGCLFQLVFFGILALYSRYAVLSFTACCGAMSAFSIDRFP